MNLRLGLYKNRELKWNVKAKDTASRKMNAGWNLINDGYRAGESRAPPETPTELSCRLLSKEVKRLWCFCFFLYLSVFLSNLFIVFIYASRI